MLRVLAKNATWASRVLTAAVCAAALGFSVPSYADASNPYFVITGDDVFQEHSCGRIFVMGDINIYYLWPGGGGLWLTLPPDDPMWVQQLENACSAIYGAIPGYGDIESLADLVESLASSKFLGHAAVGQKTTIDTTKFDDGEYRIWMNNWISAAVGLLLGEIPGIGTAVSMAYDMVAQDFVDLTIVNTPPDPPFICRTTLEPGGAVELIWDPHGREDITNYRIHLFTGHGNDSTEIAFYTNSPEENYYTITASEIQALADLMGLSEIAENPYREYRWYVEAITDLWTSGIGGPCQPPGRFVLGGIDAVWWSPPSSGDQEFIVGDKAQLNFSPTGNVPVSRCRLQVNGEVIADTDGGRARSSFAQSGSTWSAAWTLSPDDRGGYLDFVLEVWYEGGYHEVIVNTTDASSALLLKLTFDDVQLWTDGVVTDYPGLVDEGDYIELAFKAPRLDAGLTWNVALKPFYLGKEMVLSATICDTTYSTFEERDGYYVAGYTVGADDTNGADGFLPLSITVEYQDCPNCLSAMTTRTTNGSEVSISPGGLSLEIIPPNSQPEGIPCPSELVPTLSPTDSDTITVWITGSARSLPAAESTQWGFDQAKIHAYGTAFSHGEGSIDLTVCGTMLSEGGGSEYYAAVEITGMDQRGTVYLEIESGGFYVLLPGWKYSSAPCKSRITPIYWGNVDPVITYDVLQASPGWSGQAVFDVLFPSRVGGGLAVAGFDDEGVILTGTLTPATIEVIENEIDERHRSYSVILSGFSGKGTLGFRIPYGAVSDPTGHFFTNTEVDSPDVDVTEVASLVIQATDGAYETHVNVEWDGIADAVQYRVLRSTEPGGESVRIELIDDPLSSGGHFLVNDETAALGTLYYYIVQAGDGRDNWVNSEADLGYRGAPQTRIYSAKACPEADGINLEWGRNREANAYIVYRGSEDAWPSGYVEIATVPETGQAATYQDSTAVPQTLYWYRVVVQQGTLIGPPSSPVQAMIGIDPVEGLQASQGRWGDHVRVDWAGVDGAGCYHVYRAADGAPFSEAQELANCVKSMIYDDFDTLVAEAYSYWVSAQIGGVEGPVAGPVRGVADAYWQSCPTFSVEPVYSSSGLQVDVRVDDPGKNTGATPEYHVALNAKPRSFSGWEVRGAEWTGETFAAPSCGTWYFHVLVTDEFSNPCGRFYRSHYGPFSWPKLGDVTTSTSNPSGEYVGPGDDVDVTFSVEEVSNLQVAVSLEGSPDDAVVTYIGSNTWQATFRALSAERDEGVLEFEIELRDSNGNKTAFEAQGEPELIFDNSPPVISGCPSDLVVADPCPCATATWTEPTADDYYSGLASLTSTHRPGETFPEGTTTVIYTATDHAGNVSTCSFDVAMCCAIQFADPGLEAAVRDAIGKPSGPITICDVAGLQSLDAKNRGISDLGGIGHLEDLEVLRLDSNNLTSIDDLANLTQLEHLVLIFNTVSDIDPLAELESLEILGLGCNDLDDISALANLTQLRSLDLSVNNITDISALEHVTSLELLSLAANSISDISSLVSNAGLGAGDEIELTGNPLNTEACSTHIPTLLSRGATVRENTCPVCAVITFADPGLEAAVRDAIGKPTGPITRCDVAGLTSLMANSRGITDLGGIEYLEDLERLYLHSNNLTSIDELASLSELEYLDLNTNRSLSNISALSGLIRLEWLGLGQCNLSDIGPLGGLRQLEVLALESQHISDVTPLANLTRLEFLALWDNEIVDISPLSGLTKLDHLLLGINRIREITALTGMAELERLNLGSNDIDDIGPLASLAKLWELDLRMNDIDDVSALAGLIQLEELGLEYNDIADISPLVANAGLGAGDEVDLTSNPLSPTSCNTHIPALQSRSVTVTHDCP